MQAVLGKVIGPKEVHPENLQGRVAVVTGGALGIGYVFHYNTLDTTGSHSSFQLIEPSAMKLVAPSHSPAQKSS